MESAGKPWTKKGLTPKERALETREGVFRAIGSQGSVNAPSVATIIQEAIEAGMAELDKVYVVTAEQDADPSNWDTVSAHRNADAADDECDRLNGDKDNEGWQHSYTEVLLK